MTDRACEKKGYIIINAIGEVAKAFEDGDPNFDHLAVAWNTALEVCALETRLDELETAEAERPGNAARACVRCGSKNRLEEHHWAPSAIFPDWDKTITITLCQHCHREWHLRMRMHGLVLRAAA